MFGLTCRDVTEKASDYLDGDLPLGRRLVFRMHLAMCGACAEFTRQIELVRDALPLTAAPAPLSDGARSAILKAFEDHHRE